MRSGEDVSIIAQKLKQEGISIHDELIDRVFTEEEIDMLE